MLRISEAKPQRPTAYIETLYQTYVLYRLAVELQNDSEQWILKETTAPDFKINLMKPTVYISG